MNTTTHLELVNRRAAETEIHVLFVGPHLANAQKVFRRDDEPVKCQHAATAEAALDVMMARANSRPFDCVMVDMRHENDASPLNVVAISALYAANRVIVLTNPDKVDSFRALTGVDLVLPAPIDPKVIISTIMESAPVGLVSQTSRTAGQQKEAEANEAIELAFEAELKKAQTTVSRPVPPPTLVRSADVEIPIKTKVEQVQPAVKPSVTVPRSAPDVASKPVASPKPNPKRISVRDLQAKVTKGFETSLSLAAKADTTSWQRFVPLANFAYKKLAIIILSALFLAFVSYGAMIVFFMASSSWSLPFEISRGHKLVEKVERDLSILRLRRNEVRESIASVQQTVKRAEREREDGDAKVDLYRETIKSELKYHVAQTRELERHVTSLKKVLDDFSRSNGRGGYSKNLKKAFSKRLITRKRFESGSLALIETLHRITAIESDIAAKRLEMDKASNNVTFLRTLLRDINDPSLEIGISAGAELTHLANELIRAKNGIAEAERTLETSSKRLVQLFDSHKVIATNVASLEQTPAARAMDAPVRVLFVPYTNAANLEAGTPLYSCALSIFWCSRVGEAGAPIGGETTTVHPLFGKPLRGTFVEAKFDDPKSVTKEMVHAGGPPLLF